MTTTATRDIGSSRQAMRQESLDCRQETSYVLAVSVSAVVALIGGMTKGLIKMGLYDRFNKGKKPRRQKSELRKWTDKLDKVLSLYVRMRDSREFHYKYFRCISCGRVLPISEADCGHYHSRVHMSLRFDTRNVNAECRRCNRFSSDHLIGYRKNLILKLGMLSFKQKHPNETPIMEEVKRLGEQQLDLMDVEKHQAKKWSVFELQQLYQYYSALILKMNGEM